MLIKIIKIDGVPEYQTIDEIYFDNCFHHSADHTLAYRYAVYLNFLGHKIKPISTGNSWSHADFATWIIKPPCKIISDELFENKELYDEVKKFTHEQLVYFNRRFIWGDKSLREIALEAIQ